ncbi:YwpF-like family protein [Mangrovibacillus cuniculi]|uniref:YwpF-like protein n=1 Tax=Mangrovibacillus cuniculi TaxID=2593652 RepID=A0A7S8CDB2_9BACI|nr:YwpF-like family protein [Mangrovibacillus cuniculi]QPC47683.1 hypothetical protein G8O30_12315 [Mangrovibacillus cuniculi]
MKTFKVVSLQVWHDNEYVDFPLIDGLIINKEDEKRTWYIEAFLDKQHYDFMRDLQQSKEQFEIQAIISYPENDPATFLTFIRTVKKINESISVLFEGHLHKRKNEYAEQLLTHLIDEGFKGDDLINEFKVNMLTKPKIPSKKQTMQE